MGATRLDGHACGTLLSRYAGWYEGLSADLRAHLAPHLFRPGLEGLDGASAGPRARAPRVATDPAREADLAAGLAARTDAALADPTIRAQWTGEGTTDSRDEPRGAGSLARTMEWMRAVEQWALLRETGLAGRRIERWLAKRDGSERRAG